MPVLIVLTLIHFSPLTFTSLSSQRPSIRQCPGCFPNALCDIYTLFYLGYKIQRQIWGAGNTTVYRSVGADWKCFTGKSFNVLERGDVFHHVIQAINMFEVSLAMLNAPSRVQNKLNRLTQKKKQFK